MSLNSVTTNIGSQVSLTSLNAANTQLQATQKRVSTGLRVADATDDGGAYAVAQRVRSDVGALTTVNEQLGNAKGLVGTALTALGKISDSVNTAKQLLVKIGDNANSQDQRNQHVASYRSLLTDVANYTDNSTYNGQTLLARIIHRTARNRPRPPNTWARDFIAKNFIKQPIRIVVNDINGLALIAHFS